MELPFRLQVRKGVIRHKQVYKTQHSFNDPVRTCEHVGVRECEMLALAFQLKQGIDA